MKFVATEFAGVFIIEPEPRVDDRGMFARYFCSREFQAHGLKSDIVQTNYSQNKQKGTLRGMHYQQQPFAEVKLVRCLHGKIYDVIIDVRPDSSTYLKWLAVELSGENKKMLYVPEGFAHGYQSLTDDSEVFYMVTQFYNLESERAIRWNDPLFGIEWPLAGEPILSAKDAAHPDFKDIRMDCERRR